MLSVQKCCVHPTLILFLTLLQLLHVNSDWLLVRVRLFTSKSPRQLFSCSSAWLYSPALALLWHWRRVSVNEVLWPRLKSSCRRPHVGGEQLWRYTCGRARTHTRPWSFQVGGKDGHRQKWRERNGRERPCHTRCLVQERQTSQKPVRTGSREALAVLGPCTCQMGDGSQTHLIA